MWAAAETSSTCTVASAVKLIGCGGGLNVRGVAHAARDSLQFESLRSDGPFCRTIMPTVNSRASAARHPLFSIVMRVLPLEERARQLDIVAARSRQATGMSDSDDMR